MVCRKKWVKGCRERETDRERERQRENDRGRGNIAGGKIQTQGLVLLQGQPQVTISEVGWTHITLRHTSEERRGGKERGRDGTYGWMNRWIHTYGREGGRKRERDSPWSVRDLACLTIQADCERLSKRVNSWP